MKKVVISGSTGFTGSALIRMFRSSGWEIAALRREDFSLPTDLFAQRFLENTNAVVHLAGAPVIRRWTPGYKEEIRKSRTDTTRKIADALKITGNKPGVLISASAVGIYDGEHEHTEESPYLATGFLAEVCREWEDAALSAASVTRVIILRTGIVLDRGIGAMKPMELPFKLGLGGTIGNGRQPMSWIHIADLESLYSFIIGNPGISGVVNGVAPFPTTNLHFTKTLGKVFNQPTLLRIPEFMLKLVYGEGASTLTSGQFVLPGKALKADFEFRFPTIEKALMDLYRR